MKKEHVEKIGIAAAILLLPGGFVLGATLAARHWRGKQAARAEQEARKKGADIAVDPPVAAP